MNFFIFVKKKQVILTSAPEAHNQKNVLEGEIMKIEVENKENQEQGIFQG